MDLEAVVDETYREKLELVEFLNAQDQRDQEAAADKAGGGGEIAEGEVRRFVVNVYDYILRGHAEDVGCGWGELGGMEEEGSKGGG